MLLPSAAWRLFVLAMAFYCAWALALPGERLGFLSPATSYVSELSVPGQRLRHLFRLSDAATGSLAVVVSWLAGRHPDPSPPAYSRRWVRILALVGLALFGAGTIADATWTFSCTPTQDSGCLARVVSGDVPPTHQIHKVTSTVAGAGLTTLIAAQLIFHWPRRSHPGPPAPVARARTIVVLALLSLVTLAAAIAFAPENTQSPPLPLGIVQRVNLMLTVAMLLLSLAPNSRSGRSPQNDDDAHDAGTDRSGSAAMSQPRYRRPAIVIHPGLGVAMNTFDEVIWRIDDSPIIPWPRAGMDGAPDRPDGEIPGAVNDAQRLRAHLDTAGPDGGPVNRVILVGHSMAGPLIETYARLYPEQVAGLVFLDASIPKSGGVSRGLAEVDVQGKVSRAHSRRHLTRLISTVIGADPGRLPNADKENAAFYWYIDEATRVRQQHRLPDIPVQVVVAGRRLPFVGVWIRKQRDYVRLLRETGAPRTRLEVIRPSGHIVQREHPAKVADIIRHLL